MNKWLSSISTVLILMIVMCSIIQFHHHCEYEGPKFTIALSHHHNNLSNITHDHYNNDFSNHCCCNHKNNESNKNCSAHIGVFQISKQNHIFSKEYPITLFDVAIAETTTTINLKYKKNSNKLFSKKIPINSITQDVESLRAPPIYYGSI